MAIHGFVLEEDTKPVHDRHMQALKVSPQAFIGFSMTDSYTPGYCSKHAGISNKLVTVFAATQINYFASGAF